MRVCLASEVSGLEDPYASQRLIRSDLNCCPGGGYKFEPKGQASKSKPGPQDLWNYN